MAPREKPTSRKHTNEANADFAIEHQAPLTISTEQISPVNQQHKSNHFIAPEQRWRAAFERSAIGITVADLDRHYLAANAVFQKMVGYTETELQKSTFLGAELDVEAGRKAAHVAGLNVLVVVLGTPVEVEVIFEVAG